MPTCREERRPQHLESHFPLFQNLFTEYVRKEEWTKSHISSTDAVLMTGMTSRHSSMVHSEALERNVTNVSATAFGRNFNLGPGKRAYQVGTQEGTYLSTLVGM